MIKITLLTILSLIFLASCGEAENTSEEMINTTSEEIKVTEVKNEITRIPRRDEVMIDRIIEWLNSDDKKIFEDYKELKINRSEFREKVEVLKLEKNKSLDEANNSWNLEDINKLIEEIRVLEDFRL